MDGVIEYRDGPKSSWMSAACGGGGPHPPTAERVAMWADLFANPTEEVEDAD